MKRTVLIPTGFDEYSQKVMDFCAGAGGRGIVKCILVHVLDPTGVEETYLSSAVEDARKKLEVLAKPIIEAGMEADIRIPVGTAKNEVVRIMQEESINVMVIGTTAKSSLSRLFVGSLSEDLAYSQNVPTLMLRNDILFSHDDLASQSLEWSRKIVVPVDYSATSARAVLQCTRFEPEAVGEVRLLHMITTPPKNQTLHMHIAEQEFRLSAFSRMLEDVGIKATPVVREGDVKDGILAEVKESGATGIVIGASSKSRFGEFLLGSTAREIVATAPVFTMVVP